MLVKDNFAKQWSARLIFSKKKLKEKGSFDFLNFFLAKIFKLI